MQALSRPLEEFGDLSHIDTDSLPLPPPGDMDDEPTTTSPEKIKSEVNEIKRSLKTKRGFPTGLKRLQDLMQKSLTFENKRTFYDALSIISFRLGKPGFDVHLAKPLFDAAVELSDKFSAGFRKNIVDWKKTVDEMVENPSSSVASRRTDGRFGSFNEKAGGGGGLGRRYGAFPGISPLMLGLNYSMPWFSDESESDSDTEVMNPFQPLPMGHPLAQHSNTPVKVEPPYPYAKFSEDLDLLTPTRLPHTKNESTFDFNFTVSSVQHSKAMDPQSPVAISLCCFLNGNTQRGIRSPEAVSYKINGKPVPIPKETESANRSYGYDITSLCSPDVNQISITVHSCCCSFAFGVKMTEHFTNEQLLQEVVEQHSISYDVAFERVIKSFSTSSDIQELSLQVSMRCPLSQTIIETPARGKDCKHLQCFDLNSFLLINRNHPKFKCPVCSNIVPLSDVVIDGYMASMLKSATEDDDEMEVNPDGTWAKPKPVSESNKRKRTWGTDQAHKKQKSEQSNGGLRIMGQAQVIDLT